LTDRFSARHTIIDPFAKFGSVLYEARFRGIRNIGFDPNAFNCTTMQTEINFSIISSLETVLPSILETVYRDSVGKDDDLIASEIAIFIDQAREYKLAIKNWLIVLLGRALHKLLQERQPSIIPIIQKEVECMLIHQAGLPHAESTIVCQVDPINNVHLKAVLENYFNFSPIDGLITVLPDLNSDFKVCKINESLRRVFRMGSDFLQDRSEIVPRAYVRQSLINVSKFLKPDADIFIITNANSNFEFLNESFKHIGIFATTKKTKVIHFQRGDLC
jgi:hypothetical protein